MSEVDTPENLSRSGTEGRPASGNVIQLSGRTEGGAAGKPANLAHAAPSVTFDRSELREILGLYGRKVAETEWRDYAMNFTPQKAIFAVFRRASEMPLYRIEKDPSLNSRQGTYAVIVATGLILRRGNDLKRVLAVLEKRPRLVVI